MASLSGNLATMGPGVPYVIAAKFAHPGRPAIALVGDGAMQMNGINGLITIAKYWPTWSDPRLVVGVLSNQDLNQVTWEERVLAGDPEYPTTQNVPRFDFAAYARQLGLTGIHVEKPDDIAGAWEDAIRADRPCVIDFVTDPERAAAAAAHYVRAGEALPDVDAEARRAREGRHQAERQGHGRVGRAAPLLMSARGSATDRPAAGGARASASARGAARESAARGADPLAGGAGDARAGADAHPDAPIDRIDVSAYTIPTDAPESDGTLAWDSTTLVLVEAHAGGATGVGFTYEHHAAAAVVADPLADVVRGRDALDVQGAFDAMWHAVRNLGRPGLVSCAISAVDTALWDLKARLLDVPLCRLLGMRRDAAPIYGSGGFTSYSLDRLREQLGGWAERGIPRVKMKVGRDPDRDAQRVRAARDAVGPHTGLFVDANGAYSRKQALYWADRFAEHDVRWLEEPVSSDDLAGLRLLRDRGPAGMDIAAGEYGYDVFYFRRMLEAEAVDVLQADATRCGGFTGFLKAAALCDARSLPFSAHTAPLLHAHVCCCAPRLEHMEYFHDHVRIERLLFDGVLEPDDGALRPDLSRPGMGFRFRRADAERYRVR